MIFGARGVTYTTGKGTFFCPGCEDQKLYRRRTVRRFATLYYVPILPLGLLGEYIECPMCGGSFCDSVLAEDGSPLNGSQAVLSDGLRVVIQRILVHMVLVDVLVDGEVADSEIETLKVVFREVTGQSWSEQAVRFACSNQRANSRQLLAELSGLTACLNDHAKQFVVAAACRVAYADGVVRKAERQMLGRIADTLQVPHRFLAEVMAAQPEPN